MSIKIRIRDEAHCREVQDALFKLGFGWNGSSKAHQYTAAKFLFASSDWSDSITYMTHNEGQYFEKHAGVEKFLVDGVLVDTEVKPVAPPLGLRPRYIVDAIRIQEILSACTRYTEAAMVIPTLWLDELRELNGRAA